MNVKTKDLLPVGFVVERCGGVLTIVEKASGLAKIAKSELQGCAKRCR